VFARNGELVEEKGEKATWRRRKESSASSEEENPYPLTAKKEKKPTRRRTTSRYGKENHVRVVKAERNFTPPSDNALRGEKRGRSF